MCNCCSNSTPSLWAVSPVSRTGAGCCQNATSSATSSTSTSSCYGGCFGSCSSQANVNQTGYYMVGRVNGCSGCPYARSGCCTCPCANSGCCGGFSRSGCGVTARCGYNN